MQNNIIILSRSDADVTVPKIIVRARNDRKTSSTIETVRMHLLQRHRTFDIFLTASEARGYTETNNELPFYLINRACSYKKPFVNNDFDYLRRSVRKISCKLMYTTIQITISYELEYLTTLYQEEQIDRVLQTLFKEKDAYNIRDTIPRIKFAYDYIIANVKYDNTFVRHSAYNALIEKSAVCEGCATLLYRMLAMFGVPCRIITGRGLREEHAWNLIKLNGKWYNADVTWDLYKNAAERSLLLYGYFMKTNSTFNDHTRDLVFNTQEFLAQHPMSLTDYLPQRKLRDLFRSD
jgi:hypothetical protein